MGSNLSDLARQLEQAEAEEEAARLRTDAARAAWRSAVSEVRTALLEELAEFGESLEVVEVSRGADRLDLSWRGGTLSFVEREEGDTVGVQYPRGSAGEVVRLTTSGVWRWERDGDSAPLITAGLEDLLVRGLGLPRPGGPKPGDVPSRRGPQAMPESGRGPSDGELGMVGRAGTRGFKRPKKIHPGAVVKDLKGPLD